MLFSKADFYHILMCITVKFTQLPLSPSRLVDLIALSREIRLGPVSRVPLIRESKRHRAQDEIKMASVNPAFQLQTVTQRVSGDRLGVQQEEIQAIRADRVRYCVAWHNANALHPGDVSEETAIICEPSQPGGAEIGSEIIRRHKPSLFRCLTDSGNSSQAEQQQKSHLYSLNRS